MVNYGIVNQTENMEEHCRVCIGAGPGTRQNVQEHNLAYLDYKTAQVSTVSLKAIFMQRIDVFFVLAVVKPHALHIELNQKKATMTKVPLIPPLAPPHPNPPTVAPSHPASPSSLSSPC